MLEFRPFEIAKKAEYDKFLLNCGHRGCEYNFVNLFCWGRQRVAFHEGNLAFFSQFNRKSVYPFPLGKDLKPTLDAIIQDSKKRGIPCRLTGLTQDDCALLEQLYPGQFRMHYDRDGFDYVYAIDDLAELKGRKFQRKRNHLNHFLSNYPDHTVAPISEENIHQVEHMLRTWYEQRLAIDPHGDFIMEQAAIKKALRHFRALGLDGIVLKDGDRIMAMTMGSPLFGYAFDVQFEKALDEFDGAYPAVNWHFARYLREKYPDLQWLNREDDLGLEGLRKAKLSYNPDHMIEKNWACLLEDGYDY